MHPALKGFALLGVATGGVVASMASGNLCFAALIQSLAINDKPFPGAPSDTSHRGESDYEFKRNLLSNAILEKTSSGNLAATILFCGGNGWTSDANLVWLSRLIKVINRQTKKEIYGLPARKPNSVDRIMKSANWMAQWANEQAKPVFIVGHSLGGFQAVLIAEEMLNMQSDIPIVLILDGVFYDLKDASRYLAGSIGRLLVRCKSEHYGLQVAEKVQHLVSQPRIQSVCVCYVISGIQL